MDVVVAADGTGNWADLPEDVLQHIFVQLEPINIVNVGKARDAAMPCRID